MSKKSVTYKDSGVDIEKAETSLNNLKSKITATHNSAVLSGVGMFGGFYDLSELNMKQPVLVSSTDGVGTKLKVAMLTGNHATVGRDLVNHCVNDIAVCGAKPLYFLDYFASGILEPSVYESVVGGLADGCKDAGIALIGGETAEMPDFYAPGDYDMCGTIVGAVEKKDIIDGKKIAEGDLLIGISGNGLHTNGYTLARKVLLENYKVTDRLEELNGKSVGEEMLRIHTNYFSLITAVREKVDVHGISHVTGGGIYKNTSRLLTPDLKLNVNWDSWEVPAIFKLIQSVGNVPDEDMRQTFNLGIGLVFVINPKDVAAVMEVAANNDFQSFTIGKVVGK